MGGITGPAAAQVGALVERTGYVFDYINDVQGGIDGVKIDYKIVDNKGTPEGAILSFKELSAWDPVIYLTVEDYYYLGIAQEIAEAQVPMLTASAIVPQAYIPPSVFYSIAMALPDGLGGYLDWVKQDYQGEGNPKVGLLYWDLPSGQQHRMVIPYAAKIGVDLEPVQFPIALYDLKPQLLQLQQAEVDYIWMMAISPNAAVAIRDIRGLDMQVPVCFSEYVNPAELIGMVGAGARGFMHYRSEAPFTNAPKSAALYTKVLEHATGESTWADNRLPLSAAAAAVGAIRQAAADVGWANIDGPAMIAALNKMENIDNSDNTGTFGYGPQRRLGITQMQMYRFTSSGTESISDWIDLPRVFDGLATK